MSRCSAFGVAAFGRECSPSPPTPLPRYHGGEGRISGQCGQCGDCQGAVVRNGRTERAGSLQFFFGGAAVVLVRGLSCDWVMITWGPCSAHRGTAAAVHLADKLTREQSHGLGDGVKGGGAYMRLRRMGVGRLLVSREAAKPRREPQGAFESLRCGRRRYSLCTPVHCGAGMA